MQNELCYYKIFNKRIQFSYRICIKSIKLCNKVLDIEENGKAYYRLAEAYYELKNY